MPHLSPMSWALLPMLLFLILMITHSSIWWNFYPNFKKFTMKNQKTPFNLWKW